MGTTALRQTSKSRDFFLVLFFCLIGILARLILIGQVPYGLNQDEASAGYEAWSILNYGIDRHGISYPVHLIAWGSGQNIAYSWFCMPFIALFGLSEFTVRFPMALIGCVSVVLFYFFLDNVTPLPNHRKYVLFGTLLFAICPWHIMKSRWGLESNLFPDLILWGSFCLSIFCRKHSGGTGYLYTSLTVSEPRSLKPPKAMLPVFIFPLKSICLTFLFCFTCRSILSPIRRLRRFPTHMQPLKKSVLWAGIFFPFLNPRTLPRTLSIFFRATN